jgi:hypothetical protein
LYRDGIAIFLLLFVGLWAYALVDCITTDADRCRNLPKVAWVLIVVLVPLLGSLLWFGFGRPAGGARTGRGPGASRPMGPTLDDHPRYSGAAGISDRRSAELDLEIERWEQRQREERERRRDG